MKKHFYHHLIETDTLHAAIGVLDLNEEERKELTILIEANIHHVVMDVALSILPEHHKKTFLSHIATENHNDLWQLLKDHKNDIEDIIKKEVQHLLKEMHEDVHEAKKKSSR